MASLGKYLEARSKITDTVIGVVLVLLVGGVDVTTGREVTFSIFYIMPVALVSWFAGRWGGYFLSAFATLTWLVADLSGQPGYSHPLIPFWNAAVRYAVLLTFALVLSELRELKKELERKVEKKTSALMEETSARQRADEAVLASEKRFRNLVDSARDVIFTVSVDGRLETLNPAFETVTGFSRQEWLGKPFLKLIYPENLGDATSMLKRSCQGEQALPLELRLLSKSETLLVAEVSITPQIQEGKVVGLMGIARDISDRKRLEEQLYLSQRMEAVGRLAGGVAHDFNNLLTAIMGYTALLLAKAPANDPMRAHLEEVQRAAEKAAEFVRQLLAFSRKQVLQPAVLDLNALVTEMNRILARLIGEDIQLRLTLEPSLGRIRADPAQIEQVIMNLVVNARDAMPEGGKLTVETANVELDEEYARHHVAVTPGPYVRLSVSDTGIGMEPETRSHMFEPFFTTKPKGEGTGLGLSTVYGVVKQSGGNIWVYSEPGQGTTLKLYFPRVSEALDPVTNKVEHVSPAGGSETILLVEDEEVVRNLARESLKMYGYTVLEAARAEQAIKMVEEHKGSLDLMVTDVVMPEMSGRQLAQQLASLRPKMRVLYMSGYAEDAILHHGVLDPGTFFIQKPFTPDLLAGKVREVLDAR